MNYIALTLVAVGLSIIPTRTTAEFDYFVFAQEWHETVCQTAKAELACKVPANSTGWGMHGIWPTQLGKEGPNYCNKSATFSLEAIDSLTGELLEYWPNCYTSKPFWCFWEHEYLKHGTCCVGISSMATEYDFFVTTLNLFKKHQIYRILEGGNIHPSNITTYKVSQIKDTVHSATGFKPLLYCYPDSKHAEVQLLQQISICMDKHFDLIDCPEESYAPCHTNKPVLYPQKPPST